MEPHITLVFPFESDLSDEAVTAAATDAISIIRPFPVQLDGITIRDTCAWIRIKDLESRVRELHDRLYESPLASFLREDIPYEPHISIVRVFTEEDQCEFKRMSRDFHPVCGINIVSVFIEEIDADERSMNQVQIPLERNADF